MGPCPDRSPYPMFPSPSAWSGADCSQPSWRTSSSRRPVQERPGPPAEWMPRYGKCRNVKEWTAVKVRWGLKVNRSEKREDGRVAAGCTNVWITVTNARIVKAGTSGGTSVGNDPAVHLMLAGDRGRVRPVLPGPGTEYWWYTDTDADDDGGVCE